MVTLGEILRWIVYTLSGFYHRIAARVLRRDSLVAGSERRFRALLEAAPDAMVIVDWHGHIALVNAQAEAVFGYRREEIVGQNITELIPARFRDQHREHQKAYLRDARRRPMGLDLELHGRRKDGSEFPVEISLSPLETDQGVLVSAAVRDITGRKLIEAELKARADALERSNADLEQFAYVASHDLSAPLRVVSGFVDLLDKRYTGQLDEQADEFIRHTLSGVERMQRLIDDLLLYSSVSRPGLPREEVDCNDTVTHVLATLAGQIAASGAEVSVDRLPTVRGEPSQVEQLFQNVIGNALKFTNAERPEVEVSAEPGEDGMWRLSVRDNGIGIDPARSKMVFRMFERLHTQDEYPGTGIGLAICKRIVEQHGGHIAAEPAPGGGTVVSFTMPGPGG